MLLNNTEDARGFNQWREAGRYVKKGSKAFYILAPMFKKIREEKVSSGEITEKEILAGFRAVAVFRFEDTEGEPIIKEEFNVNMSQWQTY